MNICSHLFAGVVCAFVVFAGYIFAGYIFAGYIFAGGGGVTFILLRVYGVVWWCSVVGTFLPHKRTYKKYLQIAIKAISTSKY